MRRHAEWITIADEGVLEFLREEPPRQPKQITTELAERGVAYDDKYIGRRCLKLAEYGLLRNLGNGIYSITEEGTDYLDGKINAEELTADPDT